MIVRDSLVHEVDASRFLFGEEVVEVTVLSPAPTSHAGPTASSTRRWPSSGCPAAAW